MIIEHRTELFAKEAVPTEGTACELLRARPIPGTNFYATPWSVHINANRLTEGVTGTKVESGFTICQHIRYKEIIPHLKRMGINVLFTPHAVEHRRFTVLPFPHFAVCTSDPQPKELLYSFIGCNTHKCRKALFNLEKRSDTLIKARGTWHFDLKGPARQTEREEYIRALALTRFSLCPRGTGPSTVRFWESLRAGAIPVLMADSMRLPIGFDWESCVVRVPQRKAKQVDAVIRSIGKAREDDMRDACLAAYRQFSGENLVSCIRRHYRPTPGEPSR